MSLDLWTAPNINTHSSIVHGFTHRTGGVSKSPFDTLNLGLHVGDTLEAVCENRMRVARMLGSDLDRMVCAEQVHGGNVALVSSVDAGRGAIMLAEAVSGVDALVTADPSLLLALFFADCVPVFFADERRGVVAIAHAGWRGLVANVLENTLTTMQEQFGTLPGEVQTGVGPCIGKEYFEVGAEVAMHFPDSSIPPDLPTGKPHVDLADAAVRRLATVGVLPENIYVSGECTVAHPERYFSHRRDQGRTGRMGGFIAVRP